MIENLSNSQIGDFILQDMIGRRAAVVLYKATQQSLKRFAMIKIIDVKSVPMPKDTLEKDFVTFTQTVVGLEHMHLQPIYDYGFFDDQYIFISARYMAGTLYELLQTGALPLERMFELAAQIVQAIAFVHSQGLIHSSLSPRNVYIDEAANAYIDDLELSRIVQASRSLQELQTLLDEPYYLSTEQLQLKPLDFRSEIYSIGAIFYHMTTGQAPFVDIDNSFEAALNRKLRNQLVPPRRINPGIPKGVETVILQMLRANPDERFPDINALQSAIKQEFIIAKPGELPMLKTIRSLVHRVRPRSRWLRLY